MCNWQRLRVTICSALRIPFPGVFKVTMPNANSQFYMNEIVQRIRALVVEHSQRFARPRATPRVGHRLEVSRVNSEQPDRAHVHTNAAEDHSVRSSGAERSPQVAAETAAESVEERCAQNMLKPHGLSGDSCTASWLNESKRRREERQSPLKVELVAWLKANRMPPANECIPCTRVYDFNSIPLVGIASVDECSVCYESLPLFFAGYECEHKMCHDCCVRFHAMRNSEFLTPSEIAFRIGRDDMTTTAMSVAKRCPLCRSAARRPKDKELGSVEYELRLNLRARAVDLCQQLWALACIVQHVGMVLPPNPLLWRIKEYKRIFDDDFEQMNVLLKLLEQCVVSVEELIFVTLKRRRLFADIRKRASMPVVLHDVPLVDEELARITALENIEEEHTVDFSVGSLRTAPESRHGLASRSLHGALVERASNSVLSSTRSRTYTYTHAHTPAPLVLTKLV